MSIGNDAENLILDAIYNAGTVNVATVYVSLHDGDPGETGANEETGGSYARQTATFNAASGGSVTLSGTVEYTDMPAGTIQGVGIWNDASAGTFYWGGTITNKAVNSGDTFRLTSLTVTLD